ncbi:Pre-mRNA-splicing factor [Spiromyces aspiralis]|uniref:Pre-mRNA-splicing factor n=1 Tax=Spiromyces aspiralis TaxID=68401 RepID=A0ACC1HRJ5_9FUNG|nr:Pre-mRNA-splicing factor [Spiromyces aspiralis]
MFANHPARQQVEPSKRVGPQPPASDRAANGSQQDRHYNIWYHRHTSPSTYTGDKSRERSTTRCNIARDSGTTLADRHPEGAYFCLFFARGCCPHGPNCHYLHRIPTYSDRIDTTKDCFGRDLHRQVLRSRIWHLLRTNMRLIDSYKHPPCLDRDYRQDMSGVGTFLNEKRTLYVGRISLATKNIEETVRRHFSEWGDIDKINVLKDRGVAFVSYMNRTNCEFAKEAMDRQSLDNDEVLNVRWAHEDPNPKARAAFKRKSEMMYHQAILADLPAEYNKGLIDKLDQEEQEEEERERKRRELQ